MTGGDADAPGPESRPVAESRPSYGPAAIDAELTALRARLAELETLRAIICEGPSVVIRWRLEPGWPVEYVSENISRFGYTAQELMSGAVSFYDLVEPGETGASGLAPLETPYRLLTCSLRSPAGGSQLVRLLVRTTRTEAGRLVCEGLLRRSILSLEDEERLRLFEQAIHTTHNGVVIADARAPDNPVIFANRAVQQISGYTPEEFLGRNCRFLQGNDRDQPTVAAVRAAIKARRTCDAVLRNFRKDGTPFWNEIRISPVTNRRGEVTHFIGVQADITARKNAEAALRASERRYRTLVTNLKEVVFQTDPQGNWTYLNRAWTEVTGFGLKESLGRPFLDYVHPDDRERNNRLFAPLIQRQKEHCRHEVRYLTQAGGHRWIQVFARLTLDEKGQITGTAGTLTDISERVEAEDRHRRQQAAIEAAIDGVAICDAEGRFVHVNSVYRAMFACAATDELIGQSWREHLTSEQLECIDREVMPQLQAAGRWWGVVKARRRDGTVFDEEISLNQIEGGGVVCVSRDVTESRRSAERIARSLREKEVMLKEIHHRVKNNMQIVSSLLNLQLEQVRNEETRTLLIDSQNRIASMALVHEKLYQSADLGRIDFTEYVRDLTDNVIGALGARTRDIGFELHATDLQLGIDTAIPCGLIINELVSNAYKHAFPGGGPGRVSLSLGRDADGRILLEVADTGRGIPPGLDLRQTRSLGMQLVHTLVQQLRGTIEVRGAGGAVFVLRLQEAPLKHVLQ